MAQYRQSGIDRLAVRSNQDLHHFHHGNGASNSSDHVAIGVRAAHKQSRQRRSGRLDKNRRCCHDSIGAVVLILFLTLIASFFIFNHFFGGIKDINNDEAEDDDLRNDVDFLTNVTRTKNYKVLKFGKGSVAHGGDSRYWERDDRRRDEDYTEDESQHSVITDGGSTEKGRVRAKVKHQSEGSDKSVGGLYNEAGRDELKTYEAEYEASLKNVRQSRKGHSGADQQSDDVDGEMQNKEATGDDEYDDGIDSYDSRMEEYDDTGHENGDESDMENTHHEDGTESDIGTANENMKKDVREAMPDSFEEISLSSHQMIGDVNSNVRDATIVDGHSTKKSGSVVKRSSRKKTKRRKFSGNSCEMKFLNSTAQIVEPPASPKFARFSLQYTKHEDRPEGQENWVPRFAGHQSLHEREKSFIARDQIINCGFVKGPKGSPSTGFEVSEDDAKMMSSCHIVVISCIFGNSDRLRSPTAKTVTRLSRKNVCFVMFVDEVTLRTLSSDGQTPDIMGFIGLWKIVVVKNPPYSDMRRVGKIPKLLPHRLFPSARYSIWLDSKLRLQLDPILILEYFLWRKDHEYAISNHYDRHCLWEEVAQNKKLNKYNHTVIDQQFAFYQADGLKRFNASDPHKLLPSNVPEGSFIMREHTPMSNLFSCLWFNEVERFTPRDQLSFAYTYHKLRRKNPSKPFHLNMFKDCERRAIAKLFRHRSEEKRNIPQQEAE